MIPHTVTRTDYNIQKTYCNVCGYIVCCKLCEDMWYVFASTVVILTGRTYRSILVPLISRLVYMLAIWTHKTYELGQTCGVYYTVWKLHTNMCVHWVYRCFTNDKSTLFEMEKSKEYIMSISNKPRSLISVIWPHKISWDIVGRFAN